MFTIRQPRRYLVPLVGTGLLLGSLFGCLTLPVASVSGMKTTAYQEYPSSWGHGEHWGHRHDRPHWRPRYELPDRYTIHKGKKCELRCERIRGTRDYRCREYRC
jgi:hypothetical protein